LPTNRSERSEWGDLSRILGANEPSSASRISLLTTCGNPENPGAVCLVTAKPEVLAGSYWSINIAGTPAGQL
jgi:hypothetical protein